MLSKIHHFSLILMLDDCKIVYNTFDRYRQPIRIDSSDPLRFLMTITSTCSMLLVFKRYMASIFYNLWIHNVFNVPPHIPLFLHI